MKMSTRNVSAISIASLILASAVSAQDPGQPRPFTTIEKFPYCGQKEKKNYVVTNREEWQELWELVHLNRDPMPHLPEVDFGRRMIVAVFQGEQLSGGYSITITGVAVAKKGKKLKVFVHELSPGLSCGTPAVITQPYHIIEVKKARKVSFEVEQETEDCR